MPRLPRFPRGCDLWSWPPLAIALTVAALALGVSAARIVARERAIARERRGLEARIRELEAETERLRQAVAASASPEAVERLAKEQLGLKRPGEEVVVIVPEREGTPLPRGGAWRFLPEWLGRFVDVWKR